MMDFDPDLTRLRTPPHHQEAEQSVLGGLLLSNAALDTIGDLLTADDFYSHEHRLIYTAIAALILASKPADVLTVHEQLGKGGADAGGLPYLRALAASVPSARHIRRYAEIVRDRAIRRKLIVASDEIASAAFNPQGRDTGAILSDAEALVLGITRHGAGGDGAHPIASLVSGVISRVSDLAERGAGEVTGTPTGFHDLDRMLSGMQAGDLLIVAARPSMGKSSLTLNIADHVAIRQAQPVVFFSLEMGAEQLAGRMIGAHGRIDQQRLRNGSLDDNEWARFAEASDIVGKCPLIIDETGGLTIEALRSRARRHVRTMGGSVGLIAIDYLQLMSGSSGREDNRATELGEISRGLKAMAKELQCPVLALSQLNRSVESRADKRPMMSDLRESGAIEQDADVIMFIYRDEYYRPDTQEPGVAELIVAKQRNGPTGMVRLAWNAPLARFGSMAANYIPPRPRTQQQGANL